MSCQLHPIENGVVFICGEHTPQFCAYCARPTPALYLCDWKIPKPTAVRADAILHGDEILYAPHQPDLRYRVVEITARSRGLLSFALTILPESARRHKKAWTVWTYHRHISAEVWVMRDGTCDAPMCEQHAREADEDVHYCCSCWSRQMEVIG